MRDRRKDPPLKNRVFSERTEVDVLCERGAASNKHEGNLVYLDYVRSLREQYRKLPNDKMKTNLIMNVIEWVHRRGGRFLKRKEKDSDLWFEITEKAAREKVGQALRDR